MSNWVAFALAALAFFVGRLLALDSALQKQFRLQAQLLDRLNERLEKIEEKLGNIDERLDDIPVSQESKDRRRFKSATPLNLAAVLSWSEGQTFRLISRSYYYPSDDPIMDDIEYRHHHVVLGVSSKFGHEVHGFARGAVGDEWQPFRFLAADEDCSTISCAGTIRLLS
jgi:hypothetical protein